MMQEFMWPEATPVKFITAGAGPITSKIDHCAPLWRAITAYADAMHGEKTPFAVGVTADNKGTETFYIEHDLGSSRIARLELKPTQGKARASISNIALGNDIKGVKDMDDIAATAWMGYLNIDPAKNMQPALGELADKIYYAQDEKDALDAETLLSNFEAKVLTLSNVPVTGVEKSLPTLAKSVKGPQKIIFGEFRTFPDGISGRASSFSAADPNKVWTRDEILKNFRIETPRMKKLRKNLSAEMKLRVPEADPAFEYTPLIVYIYEQLYLTADDPDGLAIHTMQLYGPAAGGKTAICRQWCADQGIPFIEALANESTRVTDWGDQLMPVLTGGSAPTLTKNEMAVNEAIKEADEDEIISAAAEAMELPGAIEVQFDHEGAWNSLGEVGPCPDDPAEVWAVIEQKVRKVINSLKRKLEDGAGNGQQSLGYRLVPGPLPTVLRNGGCFSVAEMATMRSGEMSTLHDVFDFSKPAWFPGVDGDIKRHECCYLFVTNNIEYDEDHPMTIPMVSRMQLEREVKDISESVATDRLVKKLGCEDKRSRAKELVKAYISLSKEARALSLPGGMDFRRLLTVCNRILRHDQDARMLFEYEVVSRFTQFSDPESKNSNEAALLSIMDELDCFRA